MIQKPHLSVIVPAYNEAKRIPVTLVDIDKHLSNAKYSYEIIVVIDSRSDDGTAKVVEGFTKLIPNLKWVVMDARGKGDKVKRGMMEAQGKYRLFTDADNSTSIDHFDKMMPYFKEGYSVVICSRDLKESKLTPPQPAWKRVLGQMGNIFVIQLLVLPGIKDTQCGFKCFTEEAATKIFPLQRIGAWGFDVEILALAKKFGFKIKEIPVVWVNDIESHVNIKAYFSTLLDVVKVRCWLWKDVYQIRSKKSL
jgi:dolichyl-phosphate beta-glucosyltransferase